MEFPFFLKMCVGHKTNTQHQFILDITVGYFIQKLKKFLFFNLNYKIDIFKIILIQIEILSN